MCAAYGMFVCNSFYGYMIWLASLFYYDLNCWLDGYRCPHYFTLRGDYERHLFGCQGFKSYSRSRTQNHVHNETVRILGLFCQANKRSNIYMKGRISSENEVGSIDDEMYMLWCSKASCGLLTLVWETITKYAEMIHESTWNNSICVISNLHKFHFGVMNAMIRAHSVLNAE